MKIKTLLVCFLAVALSLTSCKKENYAEKFVGNYNGTLTPSVTISIPEMEMEEVIEGETLEGLTFSIAQVGETQDVSVTFPLEGLLDLEDFEEMEGFEGIEIPQVFVLNGTCDETGLHLNGLALNQTLPIVELGAEVTVNLSLGNATIAEPTPAISWTSELTGTLVITIPPMMEDMPEMTIEATIAGGLKIDATKQ